MKRRTVLKALGAGAALAAAGGVGGMAFLHGSAFGALPEGADLERVLRSPHQKGGVFFNFEKAQLLQSGNFFTNSVRWLLSSPRRTKPAQLLPVRKDDVSGTGDVLVWLGHSSFFLRLEGVNMLVDPVFSDHAAPVSFANRAFAGTSVHKASDFPRIDVLLLTHDHWDHLDRASVLALAKRTGRVVTGLGTGAHLRLWGCERGRITELDWDDEVALSSTLRLRFTTSRHFAGRSLFNHDRALWGGFLLTSPSRVLYLSGDGGYGSHFAKLRQTLGGRKVDLALLEQGQYNERWPHVHMFPEQAADAAEDVGAAWFLPSHIGRFCISEHAWDDPFLRAAKAAEGRSYRLLTPLIGQAVDLEKDLREFPRWWEGLA